VGVVGVVEVVVVGVARDFAEPYNDDRSDAGEDGSVGYAGRGGGAEIGLGVAGGGGGAPALKKKELGVVGVGGGWARCRLSLELFRGLDGALTAAPPGREGGEDELFTMGRGGPRMGAPCAPSALGSAFFDVAPPRPPPLGAAPPFWLLGESFLAKGRAGGPALGDAWREGRPADLLRVWMGVT